MRNKIASTRLLNSDRLSCTAPIRGLLRVPPKNDSNLFNFQEELVF
uniref:Uncharacterized protein n=1 Tax=Arundo donax TaxID=35708 RepID=A0A0A9E9C8_ARUDO